MILSSANKSEWLLQSTAVDPTVVLLLMEHAPPTDGSEVSESSTFQVDQVAAAAAVSASERSRCSREHPVGIRCPDDRRVTIDESRNDYWEPDSRTFHAWDKHTRWYDPSLYASNLQLLWKHVRYYWETDEPTNPQSTINVLDDCAQACAFLQTADELPDELADDLVQLYVDSTTTRRLSNEKDESGNTVACSDDHPFVWGLEKLLQSNQPQPLTLQSYRRAIVQAASRTSEAVVSDDEGLRRLSEQTWKGRDKLLFAQLIGQAQAQVVEHMYSSMDDDDSEEELEEAAEEEHHDVDIIVEEKKE